ncbi:MAG: TolC family protein [Cyclobacteriaceae bacterium]
MAKRFFIALISALQLGAFTVTGQGLTLSDAVLQGLENNFSIQIEEQRVDIARNNNNAGEAGMFPSITLGMSETLSLTELDNPAGFLRSGNIKGRAFNPTAAVSWTVFNGFNVRITKDRLEYLEQQSMGNAQVVVENSIQAIILAYYTALLEEQRLDVFQRTLGLSRDRYDYGRMRGELGTAVTFDILQDKNAYLTDSSNYISQVLNYRNSLRNLNLLMGIDVDEYYDLSDSLEVEAKSFVLDELYGQMTSTNSNLKNQFITQEILRKDVQVAKSGLYPSINLNLNGSRNGQVQDLSGAEFANGTNGESGIKSSTLNYTAGLTLSYTLFNGGRIRRQLENSRINEQIGQLQIAELKQSLKNNLISTYDQYNLRNNLLEISRENVETSELNLQLATDRYRNGTISSFDFRDIQITFLTTSLQYLQAIYNLIESETELMRLTGGITEKYDE